MATTSGGGGGKEDRRRRLAERGSDRMALITGRIQTLPPTPPSSLAPGTAASSTNHHHPPRHSRPQSYSAAIDCHQDRGDDDDDDLPYRRVRPQSLSSAFTADYHVQQDGKQFFNFSFWRCIFHLCDINHRSA